MAKTKTAARGRSHKAARIEPHPPVSSAAASSPLSTDLRQAVIDTADAIASVDHVRRAYEGVRDLLLWQGGDADPGELMLERPQLESLLAVLNDGFARAIGELRRLSSDAVAALVDGREPRRS